MINKHNYYIILYILYWEVELDFSISDDNILWVDGKFLQAKDTSAEDLFQILADARWLIEQAIEDMYQKLARDPELTVRRGSVWVMRLTDNEAKAITPLGLVLDSLKQEDRGVYTNWLDVKPRFWPYAEAVWQAGLRPESRRSDKVRPMNGFCLLARLKGSR